MVLNRKFLILSRSISGLYTHSQSSTALAGSEAPGMWRAILYGILQLVDNQMIHSVRMYKKLNAIEFAPHKTNTSRVRSAFPERNRSAALASS